MQYFVTVKLWSTSLWIIQDNSNLLINISRGFWDAVWDNHPFHISLSPQEKLIKGKQSSTVRNTVLICYNYRYLFIYWIEICNFSGRSCDHGLRVYELSATSKIMTCSFYAFYQSILRSLTTNNKNSIWSYKIRCWFTIAYTLNWQFSKWEKFLMYRHDSLSLSLQNYFNSRNLHSADWIYHFKAM